NELLQKDDEESRPGRDFWQQRDYSGIPQLLLPFERKPEPNAGFERAVVALDLVDAAKINAAASGDIENFLFACWQALLWRMTGQQEIVTGYLTDGRTHEELGNALGRFTKSLTICSNFEAELSFRELLDQIRDARAEAAEHQD